MICPWLCSYLRDLSYNFENFAGTSSHILEAVRNILNIRLWSYFFFREQVSRQHKPIILCNELTSVIFRCAFVSLFHLWREGMEVEKAFLTFSTSFTSLIYLNNCEHIAHTHTHRICFVVSMKWEKKKKTKSTIKWLTSAMQMLWRLYIFFSL